ncbi:hypothetical protein C8Q69DRAFT_43332 [Paecilomyces variotii]|uniref:Uncharacterized protein n=1 Tax=Byssochlamys spectabilis TaxID=264951 RepID=A0A443I789_BYSSP|nr:hypothetical protein C8Q69DRAFT_43332 [Paecilomyces variotii]RWQ99970.1 hypothetical protein C8Q69DRAFT_43332 [Paecilomyces variotii]
MTQVWTKLVSVGEELPTTPTASRKSVRFFCDALSPNSQNLMVGTTDISLSVSMAEKDKTDLSTRKTTCGTQGNCSGRYIHWGIHEHLIYPNTYCFLGPFHNRNGVVRLNADSY